MAAVTRLPGQRAADISARKVVSNVHPMRTMIGGAVALAIVMAIGVTFMREPIASVMTSNLPPRISGN